MDTSVTQWLREYVETRSESAFACIVSAHVDLVYSAAMRQVHDRDLAEEVTQTVFILLARKAASITSAAVLPAWLIKTTRFTALNALKRQTRRKVHEQRAAKMVSEVYRVDSTWKWLSPVLDEGLTRLSEKERQAITLRFLSQLSMGETGAALGITEEAAGMRVHRALEKLRAFFDRKGVTLSVAAIGGILFANSVQAAPRMLATSVAANALRAAANPATSALASAADAVSRALMFEKIRVATLVAGIALAIGVITSIVVHDIVRPIYNESRPDDRSAPRVDQISLNIWRSGST